MRGWLRSTRPSRPAPPRRGGTFALRPDRGRRTGATGRNRGVSSAESVARERMGLEVSTVAPVHGEPVSWSEFVATLNSLERRD